MNIISIRNTIKSILQNTGLHLRCLRHQISSPAPIEYLIMRSRIGRRVRGREKRKVLVGYAGTNKFIPPQCPAGQECFETNYEPRQCHKHSNQSTVNCEEKKLNASNGGEATLDVGESKSHPE